MWMVCVRGRPNPAALAPAWGGDGLANKRFLSVMGKCSHNIRYVWKVG